jgi:hypothetical protein
MDPPLRGDDKGFSYSFVITSIFHAVFSFPLRRESSKQYQILGAGNSGVKLNHHPPGILTAPRWIKVSFRTKTSIITITRNNQSAKKYYVPNNFIKILNMWMKKMDRVVY